MTAHNANDVDTHKLVNLTTSQRLHIEQIKDKLSRKYKHLNATFFDDSICMQAKINISVPRGQSLLNKPGLYADILQTEHFVPETFKHHSPNPIHKRDRQQYVLSNDMLKSIGHDFVLKATFGPSFISLWFRNESTSADLEASLCYAFEVMNKLHDRIQRTSTSRAKDQVTITTLTNNKTHKWG
ncbi:MAG: hypothetical protein ACJA0N_002814 [Pseudohongiellaceae bacterium]|jgi:hypothetical protein